MVADGRHVGDVGGDGLDLAHELVTDATVVLKLILKGVPFDCAHGLG